MFPKRLLTLTLFAALAVMPPCVLRAQWQPTNGLYGGGFSSVVENGGVLFGEFSYGMFRSTDGGITWSPANRNLPNATIWGFVSDGTHVFLGTEYQTYLWSDDSMAWVPTTPFKESEFVEPLGIFRNILYACTGPIYRSEDEGLSWTKIDSGFSSDMTPTVFAAVDSFIFIDCVNDAGDSSELFRSSDSGSYWTQVNSGAATIWCFTSLGKNLFAGSSRGVLRSTDYGVTWDTCNNGLPQQIIRIVAIHGSILVVCGPQGVYVSRDSGASWLEQSQGFFTGGGISAMTFVGDTLLIGTGIGNYLSVDTGRTWISSNHFISVPAGGLFVQDSIIFAGDFFRSTDTGLNWSFPITEVSYDSGYYFGNNSLVSQGRNIYAASYGVFLSTDNGVTWTSRSNGLPYSNTQSNINCLAVKGSKIFAGSEYDGIFVSTDSGASWTAANDGIPPNPLVYALCVAGNDIVAGLNTGNGGASSVFFSIDDGQSWSSFLDGPNQSFDNCSLVASVDDTTIYAEVDGGLYRSNLHDASWTKLSVSASSFVSIDTMIFAGGEGIMESFDKGDNWIQVDSGITFTDILSLAVGDSMLFAGTSYYDGTNYPSIPTIWRRPLSEMTISPYILGASADTINFGTIPVGKDSLQFVTITNDGKAAVTIESFPVTQSQNAFITSDLSSEVILNPGEHFTFEVLFTPTQPGAFSANIGIVSEAKRINITLIGTANGVAGVEQQSEFSSIVTVAPNPFSQSTEITFTSQSAGYAEVSIVNMLGVEVARLFSGELGAGEHSFEWDAGKNACASQGVYECLVRMNGQVETLPMIRR